MHRDCDDLVAYAAAMRAAEHYRQMAQAIGRRDYDEAEQIGQVAQQDATSAEALAGQLARRQRLERARLEALFASAESAAVR